MPPQLDQAIRDALCICFPDSAAHFANTRSWHGSVPAWTLCAIDPQGAVVAHAGIVDRTVTIGGKRVRVGGIQNVMVLPSRRGQGLVDEIMRRSEQCMIEQGLDLGILFCLPGLEKVYRRTGWITWRPESIVRVDETGKELDMPDYNVAMYLPLKMRSIPAGPVHLGGNDW